VTELSERLNTPVSTAELERRWAAVRVAMEHAGLDVLVMQQNSEKLGGYVRWFTDLPAFDYPITVVFPREGAMTVVMHGPAGARELPLGGDGILRGVGRVIGTASFASAHYTRTYDVELALPAIEPFGAGRIGLVGTYQLGYATGKRLAERFGELEDVSELVDAIKAVKSPEEQELIRATARLQDAVMQAAVDVVAPGMRESDVTAAARKAAQDRGSESGILLCGAAPIGTPAPLAPRHLQNRVLRDGDVYALLVEVDGAGGQYAEVGRMITIGPVPDRVEAELELLLAAQRFTVERLRPGKPCAEIFAEYDAYLREIGRPQERRIHAHGQGYDLVERPLIRWDETMRVDAGMNLAVHPAWVVDGFFAFVCDNWLVGPDGPGERLHRFPQEIVRR
jgi:Xaa-Pro aminopeptidase